jgi:iron complex transport system substrate-binding protein
MRAKRLLGTATILAGLVAAGCGGNDDPASQQTGSASGAFPVTIEHARGSTTIEGAPERIVVVGYTDHETLLALGIKPVGAMDWFAEGTYARWPWEREAWAGDPAQVVSSKSYEIDFERVAEQRPDLILGIYADLSETDYDKLSQIAPTVAQAKGTAYTTPWREQTRTIARAVGRLGEAENLIADLEERFAAFRDSHPELQGKTALVVDAGTAPRSYYPFASTDPRGQFLGELGFAGSREIDRLAQDGFGAEISSERVDLLDVDYLFLLIDPGARRRLDDDPLFNRLKVARKGNVISLPYYSSTQIGAAMAFNTVLSIPYALQGIGEAIDSR